MFNKIKDLFSNYIRKKKIKKVKRIIQLVIDSYKDENHCVGMCVRIHKFLLLHEMFNCDEILKEIGFNYPNFKDFVNTNFPQYSCLLSDYKNGYWLIADFCTINPLVWINVRKEFLKSLL